MQSVNSRVNEGIDSPLPACQSYTFAVFLDVCM